MKNMKSIVIAVIAASISASISGFCAEWRFDGQIFGNKAEAKRHARAKAMEQASALFSAPSDGFIALEKGKSKYLALPSSDERARDFRCSNRAGESLKFEGQEICVLTLRQYANKLLKNYEFEKVEKDAGGFRRASAN